MSPPPASDFGALLRRHRRVAGLTQEDLAERAGVSVNAISAMERGLTRAPHRDTVALLAEALQLSQEARAHLVTTARRSGLPASPAPRQDAILLTPPLIGRAQEMQAISALLQRPEVRLLTLTGTAGVGKTRLAIEVARELAQKFEDGVQMISLAPLSDPTFVIPTIAHGVGITESRSQPLLDQLKATQRDKQQLLVLDNFEHVIEVSSLLVELLEACPNLKLLVTSREVLRLRAEHQFVVPPLALPDPKHLFDDRSIEDVPAVQLFLQRAQAIRSDFQLTTDNAGVIAEICLRLDGLPLAIELAAARINLLPLKALLTRLTRRLTVLTRGSLDAPERQQTLRNTLAWSYQLLHAQEQRLFRRLAIFTGGCTLQAIEAISAALDEDGGQVLEGVASLLDKSLLRQTEQEGEEPRLLMLETIREYGLECLVTCGEMEIARLAHAEYYLQLAEQAQPELKGPNQAAWLKRLEWEHENLRAAMGWLLESEEAKHRTEMSLRFVEAVLRFWLIRGHWSEGRTFLEQALARSAGVMTSLRAHVLCDAADLAYLHDEYELGRALCEESLALFRAFGDKSGIATCLFMLGGGGQDWGRIAGTGGTLAEARSLTEEALALHREVGNKRSIAYDLFSLAETLSHQGEYARARTLLEESLGLHKELGDAKGRSDTLLWLAWVDFLAHGASAQVRSLLEEGLVLLQELGDKWSNAFYCYVSGQVALHQGDAVAAQVLAEESVELYREIGHRQGTAWSLSSLAGVIAVQGNPLAARMLYEESLAVARAIGDKWAIASCFEGLASVVAVQGELVWAARLWGAAGVLRDAIGIPIAPVYRADYDHSVAAARAQLGEQAFAEALAEGRAMPLEQVLDTPPRFSLMPSTSRPVEAMALEAPARSPELAPLISPSLTPREKDVLRLLSQGLTSPQIAERLVISVVTVNFHVRSIYSKLGVTSRAAATRYALEHHLV